MRDPRAHAMWPPSFSRHTACAAAAFLLVPAVVALCHSSMTSVSCSVLPARPLGKSWQQLRQMRSVHGASKGIVSISRTKRAVVSDASHIPTKSKLKVLTSMVKTCSTATGALSVLKGETPSECDDVLITAAIYRLAHTRETFHRHLAEDRAFLVLLKRARQMLQRSEVNPRGLANIMWAMAAARDEIPELQLLAPFVARELIKNCSGWNPQETSNTFWGVATLWHYVPDIREELHVHEITPKVVKETVAACKGFKFQELGNALLAVTLLREDVPSATDAVPALMERLAGMLKQEEADGLDGDPTFSMVSTARMVPALAILGCTQRTIIDSLAKLVLRMPIGPDGNPTPLINVCCGLASLGVRHKRLLSRVAKCPWNWRAFKDWDVAALAWTFDASDKESKYENLRRSAHAEASRRGLTEDHIKHSRFGYMFWDDFNPADPA